MSRGVLREHSRRSIRDLQRHSIRVRASARNSDLGIAAPRHAVRNYGAELSWTDRQERRFDAVEEYLCVAEFVRQATHRVRLRSKRAGGREAKPIEYHHFAGGNRPCR